MEQKRKKVTLTGLLFMGIMKKRFLQQRMHGMAATTYNNYLRQLLSKCKCILAFDTAADYLGLTNGGNRSAAQIFVTKEQDVEGTQQFTVPSFSQIECEEHHGLLCTTVNRTIVDLLERDGDEQIITESLANYYEEHGESFDGLRIPGHLRKRFEKYSNWAKKYYEE